MMRYRSLLAVIAAAFIAAPLAQAQTATPSSLIGYWMVKKKDVVVRITPCSKTSDKLCGYIAWVAPTAKQQKDSLNPDVSKRERSLCGIRVMWNMQPLADEPGTYDGEIYKANSGKNYDAMIHRNADGKLELRGYVGVPAIGKTSMLSPVGAKSKRWCRAQ